ncbi:hypothetical protein SCHPADRAFT_947625 [Schizopora paradoxa]|uniref:Uncharacterized protein n=1 Tax=Schizopora paradoxa TaxID=27342 RepID=A0A0H2QY89_9AGAM|nr:hypothetical protein SCHPADRAFT_947625 [Schizopora paradoxa]
MFRHRMDATRRASIGLLLVNVVRVRTKGKTYLVSPSRVNICTQIQIKSMHSLESILAKRSKIILHRSRRDNPTLLNVVESSDSRAGSRRRRHQSTRFRKDFEAGKAVRRSRDPREIQFFIIATPPSSTSSGVLPSFSTATARCRGGASSSPSPWMHEHSRPADCAQYLCG